jgi:hypothetical protein
MGTDGRLGRGKALDHQGQREAIIATKPNIQKQSRKDSIAACWLITFAMTPYACLIPSAVLTPD